MDKKSDHTSPTDTERSTSIFTSEDWWAVWLGGLFLIGAFLAVFLWCRWYPQQLADIQQQIKTQSAKVDRLKRDVQTLEKQSKDTADKSLTEARSQLKRERKKLSSLKLAINPIHAWFAKPGSWSDNPIASFYQAGRRNVLLGLLGVFVLGLVSFGLGSFVQKGTLGSFVIGFVVVFLLATLAYVLAAQEVIRSYNLEYALWALLVGLIISNTIGTPAFLKPAARTEFYIKTGLVLLGAEILFGHLLKLGVPGIFVSWVVTPIVLISTYLFGQYFLKIQSRSLNMVISADMSVCGVSAAIATAAACRAKKEELSLAIGMSLTFTVIMMVVMPVVIRALGMSDVLGGAWMGGTIDSTGAVAAAGGLLGDSALAVAATVKMIQNILIGVIAFGVAVYWVSAVERSEAGTKLPVMEIWYRFPKFVLGFVAASITFSLIHAFVADGPAMTHAVIQGTTKTLRGWFFCLAFVSIGLETNFRALAGQLQGGKPLLLYLVGQSFNLCLTLLMAWLMFEVLFADEVANILGR